MNSMLKKACIAIILGHPKKAELMAYAQQEENSFTRMFKRVNEDSLMGTMNKRGDAFTKLDIMDGPLHGMEYAMVAAEAWDGFHKFASLVEKNDEGFTADDFVAPLLPSYLAEPEEGHLYPSLLTMALSNDKIYRIFDARIWGTRADDMMDLFYHIDKSKRGLIDILNVRRVMAQSLGMELREDVLKRAHISVAEMQAAVRKGELAAVDAKLKKIGKHVVVEDLLLLANDGGTPFNARATWRNLDKTAAYLAKHDEFLTAEIFVQKRASKGSFLDRAARLDEVEKLFTPNLWVGRLAEMDKMYQKLTIKQREDVDFTVARRNATELSFDAVFKIDKSLTKKKILAGFTGLKGDKAPKAVDGAHEDHRVMPLASSMVWAKFDEVQAILAKKNQALTLDDLRGRNPADGRSYMQIAAHYGAFDHVRTLAAKHDDALSLQDILLRDHKGKSLLDELDKRGKVSEILEADLWTGRVQDLMSLIAQLPSDYKTGDKKIDFEKIVREVNQKTLRNITKAPKI